MHVLVRERWTDGELDEFEKRVEERFDEVYRRFEEVDAPFESLQKK